MSWRTYRTHFAEVVNDAGAAGAVLWISDMDIRPPVLWKTPAVYWFQNLPRLLWWFPLLCVRVNSEPCNYNVINCHSNHWSVRSHIDHHNTPSAASCEGQFLEDFLAATPVFQFVASQLARQDQTCSSLWHRLSTREQNDMLRGGIAGSYRFVDMGDDGRVGEWLFNIV